MISRPCSPRRAGLALGCLVLTAGCGSQPSQGHTTAAAATPSATGSLPPAVTSPATAATAGPTAAFASAAPPAGGPPPTQAALVAVYAQLHPTTGGGDCVTGATSPVFSTCPLTPRLVAALNAAVAKPGPGANPLCGCQALDPNQAAAYIVGTPPGGGTIRVRGFGAPLVTYVVIRSGGRLLIDDIIYCSPSPRSIYPDEAAGSC